VEFEGRALADATVEALATEDRELDLDHIEPAGVLGRVVKLELLQDTSSFGRREGFVEVLRSVRAQVVHHDADAGRVRAVDVDQLAHALGALAWLGPNRDLAFIYLYTKLHRQPPAEADIQKYFGVGAHDDRHA
jgi:hypothetical protein